MLLSAINIIEIKGLKMTAPSVVQSVTMTTWDNYPYAATPITLPKPITKGNYILVFLETFQPEGDEPVDTTWPPATTFAGLPLIFSPNPKNYITSWVPVYGGVVQTTTLPNLPAEPWSGPNPQNAGTIFTVIEIKGVKKVAFEDIPWTQNPDGNVSTYTQTVSATNTLVLALGGYTNGYGAPVTKVSPSNWKILDAGGKILQSAGEEEQWFIIQSNNLPVGNTVTTVYNSGITLITTGGTKNSIGCIIT